MTFKTRTLAFIGLSILSSAAFAVTDTYNFTGSQQVFVVPSGVSSVTIDAWGAAGGHSGTPGNEGLGGWSQGTLAVTPGDTLYIYVGGQGTNGTNSANCGLAGGFNGGGATGTVCCSNAGGGAGSGGGASDVRLNGSTLNDRVIVAGGGAGGGSGDAGGIGGGLVGGGGGQYNGVAATGGTQSAGGIAGGHFESHECSAGTDGGFGFGGIGDGNDGGGSGGGWYGGGGGANNRGGGGGSSFIDDAGLAAAQTTSGVRAGDGEIQLTYTIEEPARPVPAMSVWGFGILITLMGMLGFSWRRKVQH